MRLWRRKQQPKHQHNYVLIGYGGAGWHVYRCECGAEEIA